MGTNQKTTEEIHAFPLSSTSDPWYKQYRYLRGIEACVSVSGEVALGQILARNRMKAFRTIRAGRPFRLGIAGARRSYLSLRV